AIGALAYSLLYPYVSGEKQAVKRRQVIVEQKTPRLARTPQNEQASHRRKAVAETLKELEERQKAKEKPTLRLRLQQAGLDISPRAFWIASAISGALTALLMMLVFPTVPLITAA